MTFQKGQVANPRGRPKKGQALTDLLRAQMDALAPDGRPYREHVTQTLMGLVIAGNMDAMKLVFERLEGKVATIVDMTAEQRVHVILDWGDGDHNP